MHRCLPYHFWEIHKPLVNRPIGSYQIRHLLKSNAQNQKSYMTPLFVNIKLCVPPW